MVNNVEIVVNCDKHVNGYWILCIQYYNKINNIIKYVARKVDPTICVLLFL